MNKRKKKKENWLVKVYGLTYCFIKSNASFVLLVIMLFGFLSMTFVSIDKSFEDFCERTTTIKLSSSAEY